MTVWNTRWLPLLFLALVGPAPVSAQAPARATINVSCAPWDGPAFELTIPTGNTTTAPVVGVAIWQAADIAAPTVFRFPDETQRVGAAWLRTHADKQERLSGSISLPSVVVGQPVIGTASLATAAGVKIERAFRAQWGTRRARSPDWNPYQKSGQETRRGGSNSHR